MKNKAGCTSGFYSNLITTALKNLPGIILGFILLNNTTLSQEVSHYGLEGMTVNDIKFYNGYLFAATDSGVYQKDAENFGSEWINIGLENIKINVVYPHDYGPIGWTVSAGVSPTFTPEDSAVIYCNCDPNWVIADTGIDRSKITSIKAMDGFPSPVICGETFAGGNGKLYRRRFNSWYKEIYDTIGFSIFNVIKADLRNGNVWVGGETGYFQPFITKSTDLGDNWNTYFLDLGGDNACYSIEFDPSDTNIIYAGMEALVMKSTDGGATWDPTGLTNTQYYFYGLSYDSFLNILYAGGSTDYNSFGLFSSNDSGKTWTEIQTEETYKGITSLVLAPTPIPEVFTLYIATKGSGVFWLQPLLPAVRDKKYFVNEFELIQNYPNPFNPVTNIEFQIAKFGFVSLKVFDVLGREVATLVNEEKHPGSYEVKFSAKGGSASGGDAYNLSGGIYFYKLSAGNFTETKKMILLK